MLGPETHQPMYSFQLSDGTRDRTHSYHDTWEATNSGLWPSKTAQFTAESKEVDDDDDSGICSPPLWTTSPPHSSQQHRKNHHRSLSPASRTQAIVRGQRELMEMVRNMPESNYELSLKDLVEHHRVEARQGNNNTVEERNNVSVYKRGGGGGGSSRKGQVKRSGGGNVERGGFYLKMVFPFSFGSKNKKNKKKKKNESVVSSSSKVTPKPSGSDGSVKGADKEWWKKSTSASRGSDSGASSINSGSVKSSGSSSSNSSSSRSNSRHEKSGSRCWHFIRGPRRQTRK